MFGTDGIRNTVGRPPFTLNNLTSLGNAIGTWIVEKYGPNSHILIGKDPRISGDFVSCSLSAGLLLHNIHLYDAEIISTPELCFTIQKSKKPFVCGIMISASHNPFNDNGIKIIDAKTIKLLPEDEIKINKIFTSLYKKEISYSTFGTRTTYSSARQEYINNLKNSFPQNFLKNTTIILDCAHGATSFAPDIFNFFGAHTIAINNNPNGTNINKQCGAVYPEKLQPIVLENKALAGFAFDGDGDRVVAVNKEGNLCNGDAILSVLLMHPLYKDEKKVVGTILTNQGFEHYLTKKNKKLIRTPVGDKYIIQKMRAQKCLLGGEPSGHIILGDYMLTGDGIFTALRYMESIIYNTTYTKMPFNPYPSLNTTITVNEKKDLTSEPFFSIIKKHEKELYNGRIIVRYSGTENKLRLFVEAKKKSTAILCMNTLTAELKYALTLKSSTQSHI